jgi:hypothetical protein
MRSAHRHWPVLLAALAAIVLLAGSTPPAHAGRGMEIALQDDPVFVPGAPRPYFDRERAFREAAKLKVSWLRVNVLWGYVSLQPNAKRKPRRPAYNLSQVDDAVDAAAAHGIRVQLAIAGPAPRWANGKRKSPFDPRYKGYRPSPRRYGEFVRMVAARFKGRVGRYTIWNEPNFVSWISPLRDGPKIYRDLYLKGYQAIKQVDPGAEVLIGSMSPFASRNSTAPLAFLRSVACVDSSFRRRGRCAPLRADGFAQHPYDFGNPPWRRRPNPDEVTVASLDRLTKTLDRLRRLRRLVPNRGTRLGLFLTEYGYLVGRGGRRVSDSTRSRYLVQGFEIARRNPRVRQLLQYELISPPRQIDGVGNPSAYFNTGLLSPRGTRSRSFRALSRWASKALARRQIARPSPPFTLPPPPDS